MLQLSVTLYRALGVCVAIAAMEFLSGMAAEPLYRVPFVTSIVLVLALPESGPAQPRCIIGGHLVCCAAGWLIHWPFGSSEVINALAVALGTLLMLALNVLHPPAGIDSFLIASQGLPFTWVLKTVLVGSVLLAAFGFLWHEGEVWWRSRLDDPGGTSPFWLGLRRRR